MRFAEVFAGRVALVLDNAGLSSELTRADERWRAALENLDEAVTIQDAGGEFSYLNRAAMRMLGYETVT